MPSIKPEEPTTFMKCGACPAIFNAVDFHQHKGVCPGQMPTVVIGHDQRSSNTDTGGSQSDPSPTGAVYTPVIPGQYPPASRTGAAQRGEANRGALLPPRPAHPPPISPPPIYTSHDPRAARTQTQTQNISPYPYPTHNAAPLVPRMPSTPQLRPVQHPQDAARLALREEGASGRRERGSAQTRTSRRAAPPPPLDLSGTQDTSRDEDGTTYGASNDDMSSEAEIRALLTGVRKDTRRRQ